MVQRTRRLYGLCLFVTCCYRQALTLFETVQPLGYANLSNQNCLGYMVMTLGCHAGLDPFAVADSRATVQECEAHLAGHWRTSSRGCLRACQESPRKSFQCEEEVPCLRLRTGGRQLRGTSECGCIPRR